MQRWRLSVHPSGEQNVVWLSVYPVLISLNQLFWHHFQLQLCKNHCWYKFRFKNKKGEATMCTCRRIWQSHASITKPVMKIQTPWWLIYEATAMLLSALLSEISPLYGLVSFLYICFRSVGNFGHTLCVIPLTLSGLEPFCSFSKLPSAEGNTPVLAQKHKDWARQWQYWHSRMSYERRPSQRDHAWTDS